MQRDSKDKSDAVRAMSAKDYEELGRAVERVYTHGYLTKRRLVFISLLRGMAYGLGIFIGGTVVVALVAWVLGFFDQSAAEQLIEKARQLQ